MYILSYAYFNFFAKLLVDHPLLVVKILQDRLLQLEEQFKHVLDHSIESDTRLMQYTNQFDLPINCGNQWCAETRDLVAVVSGQQRNIYRYLEDIIRTKLKTSSVVVSTLPHRHDLPTNHQINQEIVCRGAGVLDFNRIGRSAVTRHGMNLRPDSKNLLAELLVECLQGANCFIRGTSSPAPASPAEPCPTQPVSLLGFICCPTSHLRRRLKSAQRCDNPVPLPWEKFPSSGLWVLSFNIRQVRKRKM
ncbi:hypothetical protein J6590_086562 [Homalodisca vitripennis]|nr:hypothetical protein J6590_086562 [Homalodisca vitripennis]